MEILFIKMFKNISEIAAGLKDIHEAAGGCRRCMTLTAGNCGTAADRSYRSFLACCVTLFCY